MEIIILNTLLEVVAIVDDFRSCIWTDRYQEYGDFEIILPVSSPAANYVKTDYYVGNKNTDHLMIIEQIEIQTDPEDGNYLIFSGRSLESILMRRIVWQQTTISGSLQNGIKKLINDAIISPTIADRKIDNFTFKDSTDEEVAGITLTAQYTGDELYELIRDICLDTGLGFRVLLTDDNKFEFSLYAGADRSYNQLKNQYVIFSQGFDNIINSNYLTNTQEYKNITLVAGEGEGLARTTVTVGAGQGLDRRELYTDARDLRSKDDNNNDIPAATYRKNLTQRGTEKLAEYKKTTLLDGEVEATALFKYDIDFFMGDIVQIENEYGLKGTARVTEMIFSRSDSENKSYPTFTMIEEELDEDEG